MFYKSPFNYIGNKYRVLEQIQVWFPKEINTMVDLFCGGCDVIINTEAKQKYANDINFFLIDILKKFQELGTDSLEYIDNTIEKWKLSKENEDAFNAFRSYYNQTRNPLDLFVLLCYSFNYQLRLNKDHEFNNSFGRNRSSFNSKIRNNLVQMLPLIKDIRFSSFDFLKYDYSILRESDFLYVDPPYLLTCGVYNDGKRGFRGWSNADEIALYRIINRLSKRGVCFALSNVLEYNGKRNQILWDWIEQNQYSVHDIDFGYGNCNYRKQNRNGKTVEILLTNYK